MWRHFQIDAGILVGSVWTPAVNFGDNVTTPGPLERYDESNYCLPNVMPFKALKGDLD